LKNIVDDEKEWIENAEMWRELHRALWSSTMVYSIVSFVIVFVLSYIYSCEINNIKLK